MTDLDQVWGLVSDVHGNYPALEVALGRLAEAGARRLAFLGDYLGRGDNERCVQRIRDTADVVILGNRDLDWRDRVPSSVRDWVIGLPRTACRGPLLLAHGDARLSGVLSTANIRRDFVKTWQEMERRQARVFAFGHSHHARVWRKASVSLTAELIAEASVPMEPGYRYLVNVGTTGLPFAGKGGPSVAVVDFAQERVLQLALHATGRLPVQSRMRAT